MDKKLSVFDYFSQVFMIYGITVLLLNVFVIIFGESAQGFSTIFQLGNKGLSIVTMLQFLIAITFTVTLRFVFMTDHIIKKMALPLRIILMFISVFGLISGCIALWDWFPLNDPKAWGMFMMSFALSCAIGTIISILNEKAENKKLTEALNKVKEEL